MDFAPEWSADGMWIFFTSDRSGRFEIWKIKAGGGEAVPVTRNGAWRPKVGPNGRWIYYNRDGIPSDQSTTLWRISADGSEESCVLKSVYRGLWAVGREEVYYAPPPELEAPVCIYRLLLPDRTREKATCIDQPLYGRIELAPDEQSLLYTQIDAIGSDIMLVENFR